MTHLDLDAIRRASIDGIVMLPSTVIALCDEIEKQRRIAGYYIDLEEILEAARAYFAAVDRCDDIVAAEQALRRAVEGAG